MSDYTNNLPLADGINAIFSGVANRKILTKQREFDQEDFRNKAALLGIENAQKEILADKEHDQKKELARINKASKSTKNPFQDSIAQVYNKSLIDYNKGGNYDNLFSALVEYGKGAEDPQARKAFMELEKSPLNDFYNGNMNDLTLVDITNLEKEAKKYIDMGIGLPTNEFSSAKEYLNNPPKENKGFWWWQK